MRRPLAKALCLRRAAHPVRFEAPGRRMPLVVPLVLLALTLLLALGTAQAEAAPKGVLGFFGSAGSEGAQFNTPRGVAVNHTSGDIYVVDSTNHRVQRFDAMRTFLSAWGIDVVRPGAPGNVPVNEQQTVTVVADGGTFTLTFSGATTGAIAFDATAAAVQTALEDLSTLDPGDVVVTGDAGGPWTIDFAGARADTDVAQMTGNPANLTGDPKSVTVATPIQGASAFETCTMTMSCKQGSTGQALDGPGGELSSPQGIAVDQTTGHVYVTNQGNRRVEKFDSAGNFVLAFGRDVAPPNGGTGLETCTTAETTCLQGDTGSGVGQFGTTMGHLAIDPRNGEVVVADQANRRVQRFNSSGASPSAFGTAGSGIGQFASGQPTRVAVDSGGSVYTVESTSTRRVQKFNPAGTSAGVFAPDHASGTSDATAPTDVAVNPANDNVLVTKPASATVSERRVLELNLAGGLVDTHAINAGLPAANGLALDRTSGRIYLSTGTSVGPRVFVVGTVTPPTVTMAPVTEFDATSATFTGTVNPGGGQLITFYRFEYSDDGGATWQRVPAADEPVGNGSSDEMVSEQADPIEPNTEYRARLVATREFAGGTATSTPVQSFRTNAAPPGITGVGAREITDTTALLAAQIDPNRSHTTYRFEYGTDTGYGSTTAVDNAGSGATFVPVSKALTGLQPATTYHFRLVATSAAGESGGPDRTFTTAANPPQASDRAYEMVSPLDKNGGQVDRDYLQVGIAPSAQSGASRSGDAVAFTSRLQIGDIESGALNPSYVARRGATGWSTEGVTPPIANQGVGTDRPRVYGLSPDLSKSFALTSGTLTADAGLLNGSWGLYMRSSGQAERYTLMSRPWQQLGTETPDQATSRFEYADATPDSRHVVLNSGRQLLPAPAPGDNNNSTAVYEWVDGAVRLASVPPPGGSFVAGEQVFAGAMPIELGRPGDSMISDDGRRVFFTANLSGAGGGLTLFVREDGATTRAVGRTGQFWAARSTGGSVAIFRATAALTAGAGPSSLYRWDANALPGQELEELSVDQVVTPPPPDPPPPPRPAVEEGPAAVNDDATSVTFVAGGVLASGATRDAPNLYLWREAQGIRHIATLVGPRGQNSGPDSMMWRTVDDRDRAARMSADGQRLLFASYAPPNDNGFDYNAVETSPEACGDPAGGGDTCRQIYLYDARSDELSCLTCVPGAPVSGDANFFGNTDLRRGNNSPVVPPRQLPRNLSADGRRAFFETARPLVSADQNSHLDVYMWEDRDLDGQGELRLLSPGRAATDAKFLDASLSGDDVFFTTREQLVGIDTDNQVDLYDARVGGGIPAQHPLPVFPCDGEACQGALSGPPFLTGLGSGGASHGDLRPGRRPSFSVARLSRAQLAQLARGRRVMVRVRVTRAGRVTLDARAKIGKRMRTVAKASKRARRAGRVGLGVKLSSPAVRTLGRKGRLNVRLAVRFAGVREARSSTLRLRRARSSGERRAG